VSEPKRRLSFPKSRVVGSVALIAILGTIIGFRQSQGRKLVRYPVPWTNLATKVGPARWAAPTISVARDPTKLANLFQVALLPTRPRPPSVDFSRNEVVLITVGPRSSTGYSLHVVRVTQSGNLDIRVREETPTLHDRVVPRVTFPYLLLVVPKSHKHVSVKYVGR
jgi:hypothetical protein